MYEVLDFINNYIGIICIITFIWFAIDCLRFKRFFHNIFEWSMYVVFACCTTYSLHVYSYNYLFKGIV